MCASVLLAGSAQAAVISFTDDHASSITDWFDTLTVSQFDPTQGTLNSVKVSFSAAMTSDMTLDNDNATATVAQGTVDVLTIGTFLGLGALGVNLSDNTGFLNLGADDSGDTDLPGDGGFDEVFTGGLNDSGMLMATLNVGDADFASFIGLGSLSTAGLGTFGGFSVLGGGGNVDVNLNTTASANLTVDYDFTPSVAVPEPAILALFGIGLLGCNRIFRRS